MHCIFHRKPTTHCFLSAKRRSGCPSKPERTSGARCCIFAIPARLSGHSRLEGTGAKSLRQNPWIFGVFWLHIFAFRSKDVQYSFAQDGNFHSKNPRKRSQPRVLAQALRLKSSKLVFPELAKQKGGLQPSFFVTKLCGFNARHFAAETVVQTAGLLMSFQRLFALAEQRLLHFRQAERGSR
jgi:hypothetical protein